MNYYSESDLQTILEIKDELCLNINKLKYDKALINWGKPNYIINADSILIVNWNLFINGENRGTFNIGFNKHYRTMVDFKINLEIPFDSNIKSENQCDSNKKIKTE
jgi:hypothetical protein